MRFSRDLLVFNEGIRGDGRRAMIRPALCSGDDGARGRIRARAGGKPRAGGERPAWTMMEIQASRLAARGRARTERR